MIFDILIIPELEHKIIRWFVKALWWFVLIFIYECLSRIPLSRVLPSLHNWRPHRASNSRPFDPKPLTLTPLTTRPRVESAYNVSSSKKQRFQFCALKAFVYNELLYTFISRNQIIYPHIHSFWLNLVRKDQDQEFNLQKNPTYSGSHFNESLLYLDNVIFINKKVQKTLAT